MCMWENQLLRTVRCLLDELPSPGSSLSAAKAPTVREVERSSWHKPKLGRQLIHPCRTEHLCHVNTHDDGRKNAAVCFVQQIHVLIDVLIVNQRARGGAVVVYCIASSVINPSSVVSQQLDVLASCPCFSILGWCRAPRGARCQGLRLAQDYRC